MAIATAKNWMLKASDPGNIEYILCISVQDPLRNQYDDLVGELSFITLHQHPHANMVKQLNLAATWAKGDLFINVSDDFDCPQHWDKSLLDALAGHYDYVVKTDDGIKVNGINSDNIISLPIMDRAYYSRFGYIYHPDYNHFFGDEELSNVADKLGRKITLPITFEHIHYTMGKGKEDATNKKNNRHFDNDKATFKIRKQKNFGI